MRKRVADQKSTATPEPEPKPERERGFLGANGYELMLASVDDRIYAELDRESRESQPTTQAESATESVLIDADEAARLMGISLETFRQRKQRGQLPPGCVVQTGRRVQYHRAKLLAWLDRTAR